MNLFDWNFFQKYFINVPNNYNNLYNFTLNDLLFMQIEIIFLFEKKSWNDLQIDLWPPTMWQTTLHDISFCRLYAYLYSMYVLTICLLLILLEIINSKCYVYICPKLGLLNIIDSNSRPHEFIWLKFFSEVLYQRT